MYMQHIETSKGLCQNRTYNFFFKPQQLTELRTVIYPLPITIWCPNSSDTTANDYGLDKPCQRVDTALGPNLASSRSEGTVSNSKDGTLLHTAPR